MNFLLSSQRLVDVRYHVVLILQKNAPK